LDIGPRKSKPTRGKRLSLSGAVIEETGNWLVVFISRTLYQYCGVIELETKVVSTSFIW